MTLTKQRRGLPRDMRVLDGGRAAAPALAFAVAPATAPAAAATPDPWVGFAQARLVRELDLRREAGDREPAGGPERPGSEDGGMSLLDVAAGALRRRPQRRRPVPPVGVLSAIHTVRETGEVF